MKVKLLFVLAFFCGALAFAQKTVTGTVTSKSDGEPLPGVSVTIKGTTTGTETDFDGNYSIKIEEGKVLVYSYLGFKTVEKTVGSDSTIDVVLEETNSVLDEIVVVGFGSQSKRKLTDNVAKINSDDIANVPNPSVINNIAGKAAGVQVSQGNGKVEAGLNVRVRGQASLGPANRTQPLYVLDGIPLINANESNNGAPTNPLLTLSPNEIESIDILKDASSAAIYGARGANGVVIITTKKGKEGKAKFSVNLSNGFSEAANTRDWLNADQYIELFTEAANNVGYPIAFLEGDFDFIAAGTDWRNREFNTDWQSLALRDGFTRDADFSVSGGNSTTTYFFSGAYNDTKGIIRGNDLERISARMNIQHKFSDKFTAGMNLNYSRVDIDRIANDNAFVTPLQAIAQPAISPAFLPNGDPNPNTLYPNFLLQDKHAFYETIIRRVTGRVFANYQIIPGLTFNTDFGYDLYGQTEDNFTGRLAPFQSTNGEAFASNVNTESFNFSNYLSYDVNLPEEHDLNVVVGTEFNKSRRRYTSVTGTQFPTDDFTTIDSAAEIIEGEGQVSEFSFVSYFARATYSYKNKYLFKASVRRDGSSRFGRNTQFGTFSAFSGGWILSEEDFLSDSETISFLKLRASYGEVGNAEIGNYAALGLFGGVSYNQRPGIAPVQPENSQLSWESSEQTDIGLEFGLFDNKITGELAYYVKNTDGLLFNRPVEPSSGAAGINQNIGELRSQGIEFSFQTKNIRTEDFEWTTNFNIGQNDNEVRRLPAGNDIITGRNILREGEVARAFYLIEYAGVDPSNGDALYNLNDGSGGTTTNPNLANRIIAGNPFPEWIGGLTNTIRYKDFDFSFTLQGEFGASIYNAGGRFQSANADFYDNQSTDQLRRWQNPGDITDVPQARLFGGNGTAHSTRYLQDGDFIRLRNITLGYSLPQEVLDDIGFSSLRVYVSGFNLLTFTDFDGYDPESRADTGGIGQVFYSAPAARTVSLGLNVTF
jgi:TonB-linked SusC/RagA family outer membrane protein